MTKKPHKQNEDNRSIVLKSHKPHILSSDKRTDRWTVQFYYAPNFIWGHKNKICARAF